ncbi:MAG: hypothetical protein KAS72_12950 [Phycisphaerales bacterium]|nr:hypothetical protein [Phycisphaerales bacterium]
MTDEAVKQGQLNPSELTVADLAHLLTAASGVRIEASHIEADIEAGAPTNAGSGGGTLNLVHYAAWLVKQLATQGSERYGGA